MLSVFLHMEDTTKQRGIVMTLFNEATVIDEKSFHHFTLGEPVKKASIIFGTNGSGKSSFCSSLVHQFENKVRLFDTDYVKDNIQVPGDIKGSRLLTREQIQKQDKISSLQKNVNEAQRNLDKEEQELLDKRESLYQILEQTLEAGKEQFDHVKILQKKGARNNPEIVLSYWFKDAENKSEATENENLDQLNKKAELLRIQVQEIKPIDMNNYINSIKSVHELFGSSYTKPGECLTNEIIKWLKEGEKIHDLSGSEAQCLFCGSTFEVEEITSRINQRINNTYATAVQQVSNTIESLSSLESALNGIYPCKEYSNERDAAITECHHLLDLTHKKQENMHKRIDANADKFIECMGTLSERMKSTKDDYIKELQRIKNINDNKEAAAKSWIGKRLQTNLVVISLLDDIYRKIDSIKELNSTLSDLKNKISDAQQESSSMKPFEKRANEALQATGADFHLHLQEDDTFQVLCNSGDSNSPKLIKAEDLSEGEMRLLGFIHFMISIHNSADLSDIKDGIQLILIDDPITSLDADNRYYITEQINRMIEDVYKDNRDTIQLIVLSHSSMDFHNFGFKRKDITRLVIRKDDDGRSQLEISNDNQKTYSDYYASVFQELVEFAILNRKEITSFSPYLQYPAKMRFIFETHARTHYKLQYATKAAIITLCECYDIPNIDKFQKCFENALDVINSLSHGISLYDQPVNEQSRREIQRAIRVILFVLYEKDKQHVRAMCGNERWTKLETIFKQLKSDLIDSDQMQNSI